MLTIQDFNQQISVDNYILKERVSVSNKKKIIFASLQEANTVIYTNMNWINFNLYNNNNYNTISNN